MANRTPESPSILDRVRSRVSGWFSPTSERQSNGSLRRRRDSDTEPFEEHNEAPPVKRLKSYIVTQNPAEDSRPSHVRSLDVTSPGAPTTADCGARRTIYDYSSGRHEEPYNFFRTTPQMRQKSQLNEVVPEVDEDDEDAKDEESLANGNESASESGASMSSTSVNIFPACREKSSPAGDLRRTSVINFGSHLQSKKPLFSDKNISMSMSSLNSLSHKRSFNASIYGSTSALSDSRLLNIQSPFYRGRTMFGGASAYTSHGMRFNSPLGARKIPSTRPSSSLSNFSASSASQLVDATNGDEVPLSSTAKRILEVMNQLSGPLSDVRKMAHSSLACRSLPMSPHRVTEQDIHANRAIRLQQPKTPYSRAPATAPMGPMKELQVPSMSQLLQMKKLQNQTEQLRKCAFEAKSTLNRVTEYKLPDTAKSDVDTKHVNKMRNKISKVRETPADTVVEQVQLPDVQLPQLKAVPKFDIQFAPLLEKKNGPLPEIQEEEGTFVFSKPIPVGTPESSSSSTYANDGLNFKFSEPLDVKQNNERPPTFTYSTELAKKRPETVVPSNTTSLIKVPEKTSLKVGSSVLEALKTSSPITEKEEPKATTSGLKEIPKATTTLNPLPLVNSFGSQFKVPSTAGTWECDSCWVRNKDGDTKCISCSAMKKGTGVPTNTANFDKFLQKESKWTCSTCLVQNDNGKDICPCCQEPRAGALKTQSAPPSQTITQCPPKDTIKASSDPGFRKLVADQKAKWECSACMTRNDQVANRCSCCDQAKPGAPADNVPQFSFSAAPSASKFTFGIVPTKADCATTSTVTSTPSGGFIFGASPATATVSKATESPPKGGFIFGASPATATVSKATESPPKGGFVFGTPAVSTSKFTFGTKPDEPVVATTASSTAAATVTSSTFKFSVPATTTVAQIAPKVAPTFTFGAKSPEAPAKTAGTFTFSSSTPTAKVDEVKVTTVASVPTNIFNTTPALPAFGNTASESIFKAPTPSFGDVAALPKEQEPKKTIDFGTIATKTTPQPFAFGATTEQSSKVPATQSTFIFGSTPNATQPQEEKPPAPTTTFQGFGGSGFPASQQQGQSGFSFGASSPATASFGATTPAFGTPSPNLFGAPTVPTTFNATPTAGGIFGKAASPFNQGGTTRSFDVNDGSEPSTKKQQPQFDFGTPKLPDSTNTPFTFGASNNNTPGTAPVEKAAFNFTARAAPNFNFTGSSQQNSSQPFSFNATSSPFNFDAGSSETGSNTPAFPIGATNLFAATPGQAPRRKMRAVRRIQR